MPIRLYDSLARETRELKPSHADGVFRFYTCGPTVYGAAHIGNFRTFVINDVIRRLLDLEFGPAKVKHVRNLTDVDDKTIRRSREEKRPLSDFTQQWTKKFHADCAALNCLPPHVEPTATGHIREQVDMIDVLMKKGNAYRAPDGSVYFRVSSFADYGKLSRIKERDLQLGSALSNKPQTADADEKEDGSDFALWKAHKDDDGENSWESPWGRGRPGWHIECSAMSKAILGDTIDLHSGGVDLLFPHHENEIAQSECCNGTQFSRHWYHSEHLLVDGKKMSKSLGNLYTLDDLKAKSVSPMALRYALLMGHPKKQLNFTLDSLHAAESALTTLRRFYEAASEALNLKALGEKLDSFESRVDLVRTIYAAIKATPEGQLPTITPQPQHQISNLFAPVLEALRDDLNTPAAIGALFTIINRTDAKTITLPDLSSFLQAIFALGITFGGGAEPTIHVPDSIHELAGKRWHAKKTKDFKGADSLRAELTAAGWSMLDGKDGYKLEPLKKA